MRIKILLIFFLVSFSNFAYGYDHSELLREAKEILEMYSKLTEEKLPQQDIEKKFETLKKHIQENVKSGDVDTGINVYVLIDGLIHDNLEALQSLLYSSKNNPFSEEFSKIITYNYARKFSYALKANRSSFMTVFELHVEDEFKNCIFTINNQPLKMKNYSFQSSAGVTHYVASYCDKNFFKIKNIKSGAIQKKYLSFFTNYVPILVKTDTQAADVPNPNKSHFLFERK